MVWKHVLPALMLSALAIAASVVGTAEEAPVTFAPANVGDAWSYVQQSFDNGTPIDEPAVRSFERIEQARIIAADGGIDVGMAVQETRLVFSPCGAEVEVQQTVVLAADGPGEFGFDVSRGGCAVNTLQTGQGDLQDTVERYDLSMHAVRGVDHFPCGHTHDLAGKELGEVMHAAGDCGVLRLLGQDGPLYVFSDGNVTIGMDPGLPVPVKIIIERGTTTVLLLDGFSPGDAPMQSEGLESQQGVRLSTQATIDGIPADAPEMEFPLEAALAAADAGFQQLLNAGYVAQAEYETVRSASGGEEVWRTWYIAVADGVDHEGLRIRQVETAQQDAAMLPVWDLTREQRSDIEVSAWDVDGPFPAGPGEAVSMDDLERAWRLHGDAPLDAWAVHHQCGSTCDEAVTEVSLGHRLGNQETPVFSLASVTQVTWDADMLHARGAEIIGHDVIEAVNHQATTWTPPATDADPDAEPLAATPIDSKGFFPTPVRLGITIASVLGVMYFLAKLGVGLWHRSVPEHPLRQEILQIVGDEPGIHHKELMRRLDRGNHVVSHHVRRLMASNLVVAQAGTRFRCYFPKGRVDRRVMAAAPVLKSGTAQAFLQEVAKQPGRNGQEIARALGVAPGTVTFHAKRLLDTGLVETRRVGRSVTFLPTDLAHQALATGIAA